MGGFFVDEALVAFVVAFSGEVLEVVVVVLADLDFRGVFEVGFSFVSTGFVEVSSFFDSFAFVSDRVTRFLGSSCSSASSAALRRFGGILVVMEDWLLLINFGKALLIGIPDLIFKENGCFCVVLGCEVVE